MLSSHTLTPHALSYTAIFVFTPPAATAKLVEVCNVEKADVLVLLMEVGYREETCNSKPYTSYFFSLPIASR